MKDKPKLLAEPPTSNFTLAPQGHQYDVTNSVTHLDEVAEAEYMDASMIPGPASNSDTSQKKDSRPFLPKSVFTEHPPVTPSPTNLKIRPEFIFDFQPKTSKLKAKSRGGESLQKELGRLSSPFTAIGRNSWDQQLSK